MSFDSLGLTAELLRAISTQGYASPTPIQAQAIPVVLSGHDLMATAQTGTGKTAAFTLPLLQRLMGGHRGGPHQVRALVLTPTRELAAQVGESVRTYGRHLPLRCAEVYGGASMHKQIQALRRGVDILVATPGRLIDHLERRTLALDGIEILVLDEADRMLDMGFLPAIERILRGMPARRQTLLFSATFSAPIRKLAHGFMHAPKVVDVARPNEAAAAVSQSAYRVDGARKRALLSHLIGSNNWRQVLVFTRTKHGADRLARQLEQDGVEATSIHGDKNQGARNRALAAFKRRKVRALVATDVAARGLDISQLPHVVNFDLPSNPEDYVHRIGRTGRGGEQGEAVSLVSADEHRHFTAIQRLLKTEIPIEVLDGFEPTERVPAARPDAKRGRPGRPGKGGDAGRGQWKRGERRAGPGGQGRPGGRREARPRRADSR